MEIVLRRGTDGKLHAEDHFPYRKADTMPTFEGGGPVKFRNGLLNGSATRDPDGELIDVRTSLRLVIEKDGSITNLSVDDRTPAWLGRTDRKGARFGSPLDSCRYAGRKGPYSGFAATAFR